MASFIVRQLLAFVLRLLWVLPDVGIWGEHTQEEGFLGDTMVKQDSWVCSLGWEDPLEKRMATHSSIPALIIPWTKEPGRL